MSSFYQVIKFVCHECGAELLFGETYKLGQTIDRATIHPETGDTYTERLAICNDCWSRKKKVENPDPA